jgi:hypothetical protein
MGPGSSIHHSTILRSHDRDSMVATTNFSDGPLRSESTVRLRHVVANPNFLAKLSKELDRSTIERVSTPRRLMEIGRQGVAQRLQLPRRKTWDVADRRVIGGETERTPTD